MVYLYPVKVVCIIYSRIIYTITDSAYIIVLHSNQHAYYRIICSMSSLPATIQNISNVDMHIIPLWLYGRHSKARKGTNPYDDIP